MKKCTKCFKHKEFNCFHKDKSKPDGHYNSCVSCKSTYNKKLWRDEEYRNNRENYRLSYRYGITLPQYELILAAQNECCAICKKHRSNFKKALAVDHDHKTGKIRGLLCAVCNKFLGHYERYLENSILSNFKLYLDNPIAKELYE